MTEQIIEIDGKMYRITLVEEPKQEEPPKPRRTGYERANLGNKYYRVFSTGEVFESIEGGKLFDDKVYEAGNYVVDPALAEHCARRDKLMRQLERFAVEHRQKRLNWDDESIKYCIYYDHGDEELQIQDYCKSHDLFGIYFDTGEAALAAIEEFKDELTWYFTEYRDCVEEGT